MSNLDYGNSSTAPGRRLLTDAVARRVFPAAVGEVGDSSGVLWREAAGTLTFDPGSPPASIDTVFDLASLTKPIATTTLVLRLLATGKVDLAEPVAGVFPEWRGQDRDAATVQDLLEHSSGLAARLVDPPPAGRREFEHEICTMRLEYARGTRALYSDLDFILLGFLVEDRGLATLTDQFQAAYRDATAPIPSASRGEVLGYHVPPEALPRTAPTEPLPHDRRKRRLLGEVHDDYAFALERAAGHAGLFGNIGGVGRFARAVLRSARGDAAIPAPLAPTLVSRAIRKSAVPGSSRALGWDTMLPTSSCGTELSASAFGHPGFTGTSLWVDPERDRYFVLLTNRVCGGGTSEAMQAVRRAFHNAMAEL